MTVNYLPCACVLYYPCPVQSVVVATRARPVRWSRESDARIGPLPVFQNACDRIWAESAYMICISDCTKQHCTTAIAGWVGAWSQHSKVPTRACMWVALNNPISCTSQCCSRIWLMNSLATYDSYQHPKCESLRQHVMQSRVQIGIQVSTITF